MEYGVESRSVVVGEYYDKEQGWLGILRRPWQIMLISFCGLTKPMLEEKLSFNYSKIQSFKLDFSKSGL